MNHTSNAPSKPAAEVRSVGSAPRLALVSDGMRFVRPAVAAPEGWGPATDDLLGWLGIDAGFMPAGTPAARNAAPVFAPWTSWCPTAFQNGGAASLPEADFAASYCLGDPRAGADRRCAPFDVMLLSPHPQACDDGLPRMDVLRAMIRAAVAEGRARIAIIVTARCRTAIARLDLAEDGELCPEGVSLDLLAMEQAIPRLMASAAPWDAVIAMPDLRGTVFAMLAETSGVGGPWPMLWHGRGLRQICCEMPGEAEGDGAADLPVDADVLALALTLALRAAGRQRDALRLYESWARLRDRGVTTHRRGSCAPYTTAVDDAGFIALICRDTTSPRRSPELWYALKNQQRSAFSGINMRPLRVVSSNLVNL
jgi:hypothetical protein